MMKQKLPLTFYQQDNVIDLSRQLLGKYVMTCFDGKLTGGMIVETEAYQAPEDRASHAYNFKKTPRSATMYEDGGICYIYLCYGVHALFNIITSNNFPHAILIRAIEPTEGIPFMLERRNLPKLQRNLTAGPGALTQALGVTRQNNRQSLMSSTIWIEDRQVSIADEQIIASPRVGIDYAGEHASLPWRFRIKDNKWTSPAK